MFLMTRVCFQVRAAEPGKVRLGFIPEEWFQFFYKKTGVTGPYTFGIGLTTYLCSKEIFVMEHEYYSGLSVAILLIIGVQKLGPSIAAYADKLIQVILFIYITSTFLNCEKMSNIFNVCMSTHFIRRTNIVFYCHKS